MTVRRVPSGWSETGEKTYDLVEDGKIVGFESGTSRSTWDTQSSKPEEAAPNFTPERLTDMFKDIFGSIYKEYEGPLVPETPPGMTQLFDTLREGAFPVLEDWLARKPVATDEFIEESINKPAQNFLADVVFPALSDEAQRMGGSGVSELMAKAEAGGKVGAEVASKTAEIKYQSAEAAEQRAASGVATLTNTLLQAFGMEFEVADLGIRRAIENMTRRNAASLQTIGFSLNYIGLAEQTALGYAGQQNQLQIAQMQADAMAEQSKMGLLGDFFTGIASIGSAALMPTPGEG